MFSKEYVPVLCTVPNSYMQTKNMRIIKTVVSYAKKCGYNKVNWKGGDKYILQIKSIFLGVPHL